MFVNVHILNEDRGGRCGPVEAPALRSACQFWVLAPPLTPAAPRTPLQAGCCLQPPDPLTSVPSSQGSLYRTHSNVWPGWAPRSSTKRLLAPPALLPRWWLLPVSPMCEHRRECPRMHPRHSSLPSQPGWVLGSGSLAGCKLAAGGPSWGSRIRARPRGSRQDAVPPGLLGWGPAHPHWCPRLGIRS